MLRRWQVMYTRNVYKALRKEFLPTRVKDALNALHLDLESSGPTQVNWPNYGKLKSRGKTVDERHCHLIKGKPTFVVCWRVINKHQKKLEIFYVGTHEKAPY